MGFRYKERGVERLVMRATATTAIHLRAEQRLGKFFYMFENKKRKLVRLASFLIEKKDVFICTHRTHNINYNINFQKSTKFLN